VCQLCFGLRGPSNRGNDSKMWPGNASKRERRDEKEGGGGRERGLVTPVYTASLAWIPSFNQGHGPLLLPHPHCNHCCGPRSLFHQSGQIHPVKVKLKTQITEPVLSDPTPLCLTACPNATLHSSRPRPPSLPSSCWLSLNFFSSPLCPDLGRLCFLRTWAFSVDPCQSVFTCLSLRYKPSGSQYGGGGGSEDFWTLNYVPVKGFSPAQI
jgi:hypothetical protein